MSSAAAPTTLQTHYCTDRAIILTYVSPSYIQMYPRTVREFESTTAILVCYLVKYQ